MENTTFKNSISDERLAALRAKYADVPRNDDVIHPLDVIDGMLTSDVFYFRPNRTLDYLYGNEVYYNYEGNHFRLFPSIESAMNWFFGEDEDVSLAEKQIVEYYRNEYLSDIMDAEVNFDIDENVAFCDYTNDDFTAEQLKTAREEN